MITKPFIERFKQSSKAAIKKSTSNDTETLLPLFLKLNQIPSDTFAPKKLADSIFYAFSPSVIIVTQKTDESLKIKHVWRNPIASPSNIDNEAIGKPASSLCEQIKNTKQQMSQENVATKYPNDPALRQFDTQTYTGFPLFDENNNVTTVISLIDDKVKTYSKFELDLIASIVQRMGRELNQSTSKSQDTSRTTSSNEQLKAELEVANKGLESLSYAVSHDLRAPLRSMDSFSLILIEDYSSNLPDEAISHLSRIRRSAKRMGDMIDDLLWLAKVTRRKLEKQEMDLTKVANNILDEIKEKHSEYTCEFEADSHLMINADKSLIKIALQHLLNNACKFSQHQAIIKLSLTHFEDKGETVYKITDNGCGFDMTYYDQLFEPFKKLHDQDEYKKGTGIGLATVKRIIQRHGGRVWAESEIDEGTSVFFTLGAENI